MSFSHIGGWTVGGTTAIEPGVSLATHKRADDDVRAISAALALCLFLWGLKAGLIVWSILYKQLNPLADAPLDGALAFGGADLFVCAVLAVVYRAMFAVAHHGPRWLQYLLRGPATYAIHIAIVIFSVASFEVTRVYGWPLDIEHLRTADDPRIIRSSLTAYAGLVPCGLILLGILARPLVGGPIATLLRRLHARRSTRELWLMLAALTVVLFGLWGTRLRKIDTFGVKQNAIVYFIQQYKPAPGPIEVQATLDKLSAQLPQGDIRLAQTTSIAMPNTSSPRDFAFAGSAKGMNVLVIQLESTSATHLDAKTTPNLMRLAKNGLSFQNHATVFTETTRATYGIYYSDYLIDLGTTPRMLYGKRLPQTSVLEVAHDAGYATALFHSGFLSYADQGYLFENKGVDKVVDAQKLWSGHCGKDVKELPWSWGVREELTVRALSHWISEHDKTSKQPFFAVYSTEFPHHPYLCPIDDKPYPETSWLNRYKNSLHYADACIGTLLDRMERMGKLENTLIVVTGDHGESVTSYPVGHGLALSREEVFTPFIISNPKLFPAPLTSKITTNHLDIAPTVAHMMGMPVSPQWLGRDVMADEIPARVMFVQTKLTQIQGVVDNGLLYVLETSRNRGRLFDTSRGTEQIISRDELLPRYHAINDIFQKWAVWRHLARASEQLDVASTTH